MPRRATAKPRSRRTAPKTAAGTLRRLIREQLAVVVKCEPQAVEGSVDALHDIRVALRRIRSLAVTFKKLDRDFLDTLNRRLAKVCDRMGEARDMDVWIGLLKGLIKAGGLENMPARDRKAVLAMLRRQRMHLAGDALSCGLFRRVKKELSARLRDASAWRIQSPATEVFVAQRMLSVRRSIEDRYRKVGNFSKNPAHDLRRAGRRMRYMAEFFAPQIGTDCVRAGKWITKAQAALGKMHDCDSALELSKGVPSGTARASVRKALKKRRAAQLLKFKTAWQRYADKGLQQAWLAELEAAAAG